MSAYGASALTLRMSRSGRVEGGCVGHAPSSFETRALRAPQDEGATEIICMKQGEFLTLRRPRSGRLEGSCVRIDE
jgi:hypothetical protein